MSDDEAFLPGGFGPYRATLANTGRTFPVGRRQTLLQGALAAGLEWPNGCRVGICGSCRCRLLRGSVSPLADFSAVLDEAALRQGDVLACRALLTGDVTVDTSHLGQAASPDQQDREAQVLELTRLTPLVLGLHLVLDRPFQPGFVAGQYCRLSVPGRVPPRCFSFAKASRGDSEVEFLVRLFPGGLMGEWLLTRGKPGARLRVGPPMGSFRLAEDHRRRALFLAGGTGLAPVLDMLEELASVPALLRPARLAYAARDQARLYHRGRLAALRLAWPAELGFEFVPVLSREPEKTNWRGLRGHLFDHFDALVAGFEDAEAYCCGPPGLVDALELYLLKAGWRREDIHADRFLPAW